VTGVKSSRRRSREFALQGVYQWLIGRRAPSDIAQDIELFRGFDKCDAAYFRELLDGAIQENAQTEAQLQSCVDRPLAQLSPIEHSILLIAACEFTQHPDVPYRVVINEAVELAKAFGGTDGHKYVNGVLDKLAAMLREPEVTSKRGASGARAVP
jgi:N utilization substance protein B